MNLIVCIIEKLQLKKMAHKIGIKSQSDWLFDRRLLEWLVDPFYTKQYPFLYQLFSFYCKLVINFTVNRRIVGAKILLNIIKSIQKKICECTCYFIKFKKFGMYLNLEDPRFIAVGYEILIRQLNTQTMLHKQSLDV
jgi:hypothetical protein